MKKISLFEIPFFKKIDTLSIDFFSKYKRIFPDKISNLKSFSDGFILTTENEFILLDFSY